MIYKGRRQILSEYTVEQTSQVENVVEIINSAMLVHRQNKAEIEYLINYKNGVQPILAKENVVRPEINNKLVVNYAQMITRTIIGYFLGTPIQYIQSGGDKKEQIDLLNRYVAYEDKSSVDKEIGEDQSICGTAYRVIYTDGVYGDDVPFEDKCLNPLRTFVVYENSIAERPLLGVTYAPIYDDTNAVVGCKIMAYSEYGLYTFDSRNEPSVGLVKTNYTYTFTPYSVGGVPIIEYPNNKWRVGDWELTMGLMEAINAMESGRMDDVQQIIQSLLVFVNADIDEETYDSMREKGVILLKNMGTNKSEIQSINNPLDQNGMNVFSQEFQDLLYALVGIPSRNNRGGGGGDTGQAVELRDGWADLEVVARNKELVFKKSEKQALKIMLTILNNTHDTTLTLMDVDIKFSRNKNNNLLVKTQGYMNLLATKTLSPADCLAIVDLVSDVQEYITRGEEFWEDDFAGKMATQLMADKQKEAVKGSDNKENDPKDGEDKNDKSKKEEKGTNEE